MTNIYLPFYYTARIKRTPGFFIKQVVLEELPIILLAFGLFGPDLNPSAWVSIILLFAALISVYEIGYAENDRVGQRSEANPKLSKAFRQLGKFRIAPFAWAWALLFTTAGVFVLGDAPYEAALARLGLSDLSGSLDGRFALIAVWVLLLLVSQAAFALFNAAPLKWRVFLYVPLHVTKYFGPLLFFVGHPVGLAFLAAHIVRTWSLYAIRRAGGDIDYISSQLVRLVFFLLFIPVATMTMPWQEVWLAWQTQLIFAFCVVRAAPEVYRKMVAPDTDNGPELRLRPALQPARVNNHR